MKLPDTGISVLVGVSYRLIR